MILRLKFFSIGVFISFTVLGQIPAGYYNSAAGLHGFTLKTALYNIIKNHTELAYNNLYTYFAKTDSKPGNVVWDMYSDIPGGTPAYIYHHTASDQCGSYNAEGDCYNREHSFPSSWFNDAPPLYSDLFNLVPTDGYVNNKRGNFPFAKVGTASWTSTNGSKVGSCTTPGYASTVFEPVNEYKGDFARAYFYIATRYENVIAGWSSYSGAGAVLAGNDSSVFLPWYVSLLLSWHASDPVSSKEVARNDSVYKYQHNRNPYIDHPEWAPEVWAYVAGKADATMPDNLINVYPVPAKDQLNISCELKMNRVAVTDLTGRTVKMIDYENCTNAVIDVSGLARGIYLLKVTCAGGSRNIKIILE